LVMAWYFLPFDVSPSGVNTVRPVIAILVSTFRLTVGKAQSCAAVFAPGHGALETERTPQQARHFFHIAFQQGACLMTVLLATSPSIDFGATTVTLNPISAPSARSIFRIAFAIVASIKSGR